MPLPNETYAARIQRKLMKKQHIVEVATGRKKADLVLKNATYVNVFSNELCQGDIAVAKGQIVGMGSYEGETEVDVSGKIVCPGFIDAHIHLESSLASPKEFVKAVIPHGTTTVITDPHEITNVMGTDGIDYMLAATEDLPVDVRFIELMPMYDSGDFDENSLISCSKVLEVMPNLQPVSSADGVAQLYRMNGAQGNIGLIRPISAHFCAACNRIRVTADGKLKPCLHSDIEYSLKGLPFDEMKTVMEQAIWNKPQWHGEMDAIHRSRAGRNMNEIGG